MHEGKILIRKRPAAGLLAGMWELPHVIVPADGGSVPAAMPEETAMVGLRDALLEEGIPVQPIGHVMDAEHTFSHIQWNMGVYRCKWQDVPPAALQAAESAAAYETGEENFRWIHVQDMERYAFPNVFIRILKVYFSS